MTGKNTKINLEKQIGQVIDSKNFRNIPDSFDPAEKMQIRRQALEKLTGSDLKAVSSPVFDIETASRRHAENLIGKAEIPLGIAGPLKINGDYAKGEFFIPLATTEGALVASTNRGCRAITAAGGAYVYIERFGITRAPLFVTKDLEESRKLADWVKNNFKEIAAKTKETGRFIDLLSVKPYIAGRNVYLRFEFDTKDAMGMNMVTIACDRIAKDIIEKEAGVKCVSLSGNVCTDKKPAFINKIERRGYSVNAEVILTKEVVRDVLKTTPEDAEDVYKRKILLGSAVAGSIGFNSHHANIVAAIFLATGQDPAHIVEGSLGSTIVEILESGDLNCGVSLPSLVLGTVGGGTQLATQKEALSVMSVAGGGDPAGSNGKKFAEIVAGAILAGEISLLSALSSGDLAKAHKRLGRGEKE